MWNLYFCIKRPGLAGLRESELEANEGRAEQNLSGEFRGKGSAEGKADDNMAQHTDWDLGRSVGAVRWFSAGKCYSGDTKGLALGTLGQTQALPCNPSCYVACCAP
jgi:hypothetical protein